MKTSAPARLRSLVAALSAALALAASPAQAASALRDGDLVAVCGDSITEQKLYSLYIQQYLLLCQPAARLDSMQFGWSGERVGGFVGRLDNDVLTFRPTVATTCYGMNDGGYSAVTRPTLDTYRKGMTEAVRKLKAGGVREIVVGSPGVVDPKGFRRPSTDAATYNETLAALRDVAREVASAEGVRFADVHAVMMDAMTRAKAAFGPDYPLAPDGVHPSANGQFAMACAFLKALGVDGDIGTLTVDFASGEAGATPGHRVTGYAGGVLSVESVRYPFCLTGPADGRDTRAMAAFLPFNDELNRYRLVVKNAPARASVTWGSASREFTAAQLAAGVNLAAEFPDNPFQAPFAEATKAIREQQNFETAGIKNMLNPLARWPQTLPEGAAQFEALRALIIEKAATLRAASRAAVKPVPHQIRISAL